MGFKLSHDTVDIIRQINSAKYNCCDLRTDSYISWGIKQDLYQIKWAIDAALRSCPKFSPEQEWVKTQEKEHLINILKNDI